MKKNNLLTTIQSILCYMSILIAIILLAASIVERNWVYAPFILLITLFNIVILRRNKK